MSKNQGPIIVDSDESFEDRFSREIRQIRDEIAYSIAETNIQLQIISDRIEARDQDLIDAGNGMIPPLPRK